MPTYTNYGTYPITKLLCHQKAALDFCFAPLLKNLDIQAFKWKKVQRLPLQKGAQLQGHQERERVVLRGGHEGRESGNRARH